MRKLAILTITVCSLLAIAGCQQQDEDVAVTAVAPEAVYLHLHRPGSHHLK